MGGNYIFSGRASGWTMGVCISAVAHLWAAGVFSTEKRWGRRFWLDCAAARTTRPEPPRRPLRLACLARCLASEAICCTRQLARSLPRVITHQVFLRQALAGRSAPLPALPGPCCLQQRTGRSLAPSAHPLAPHLPGVVPGGSERVTQAAGPTTRRNSGPPFLCRKDAEARLSDKLPIF